MELRELSNYAFKQNVVHAFNLTSSDYNVGLLGSTFEVVLLEMKHSSLVTHTFPYTVEIVKLQTNRPAAKIVSKFDMAEIYLNTSCTKRQYFALDPIFVYELSEEPVKPQPIVLSWSPKQISQPSILAVVLNNGSCEFRRRDTISREWKIEVGNLNQLYLEMFPVEGTKLKQNFETMREAVENVCTTAFSWNMDPNDKRSIFVTANATGWLLLFSIEDEIVRCIGRYKTSLGRISLAYFCGDLIIACSLNGIIKIFNINQNEIKELDTLWPNADKLTCKKITMTFCKDINQWICVTSKSANVVVFILSKEGKLLSKSRKYLGNIKITGFDLISPTEYIFVFINCCVKLIKLKMNQTQCEIDDETIKHDFDDTNYQILGVVSSPNKVMWTFNLSHNKPYKHPSAYSHNDSIVSVCSFSERDAFKMLSNETNNLMDNSIDCAEVIRLEILKDNISPKFESISIQDFKISQQYLQKLQLKLLLLNAELIYQRVKFNHVKKAVTNEITSITRLIESIYLNLRLQHLRGFKGYTSFQMLSGKCMKYKLKILQSELITQEDTHRNIHENLNTLSDCLLMDLGTRFDDAKEKCSYCGDSVDFATLMCSAMHSVPRCSISYLQIPLFTKNYCASCNRLFVDNVDNLKSICEICEEVKCTFCGFAISTYLTGTFDANKK